MFGIVSLVKAENSMNLLNLESIKELGFIYIKS